MPISIPDDYLLGIRAILIAIFFYFLAYAFILIVDSFT